MRLFALQEIYCGCPLMNKSRVPWNLYGRVIRVGVGVGAGDVEVDIM